MDAPALREGRRIHPARRGHRGVSETGNRQADHPLGRQPAARLRNPAEQILLPLPAAHASERLLAEFWRLEKEAEKMLGGADGSAMKPSTLNVAVRLEWFGEIPLHWRCEHLKRFATRIQTGTTRPNDTPDVLLRWQIRLVRARRAINGNLEQREPRKVTQSKLHCRMARFG